jgi:hypothetical protein
VELISLLIDRDLKALQNSTRSQRTFLDQVSRKTGRSVYMEQEASMALLAKRYATRKARKEPTGATKQKQADAPPRSAGRPKETLREKPRQGASAEPNGDRSTGQPGGHGDTGDGLGDRERVRQQKKAEEARKKAEETKARVAEENRRHEERAKTSDADGLLDSSMNMGLKRRATTRGNFDPEQERAREERAREERAREERAREERAREERAREEKAKEERAKRERANKKGLLNPSSKSSSSRIMAERLDNSEAILLKLKLHYMRTRSAEMVISFLYGTNIDGEYPCLCLCLCIPLPIFET